MAKKSKSYSVSPAIMQQVEDDVSLIAKLRNAAIATTDDPEHRAILLKIAEGLKHRIREALNVISEDMVPLAPEHIKKIELMDSQRERSNAIYKSYLSREDFEKHLQSLSEHDD